MGLEPHSPKCLEGRLGVVLSRLSRVLRAPGGECTTRIGHIHRCYKRYRAGAVRGAWGGCLWGGRGVVMQDRGYELRRTSLLRTRVNKPVHTSKYLLATTSSD
jgi:hypothetical protein